MITMGCDIGSLFTKAVILNGDDLIASRIRKTTGNIADEMDGFLKALMLEAGIERSELRCLAGTGSGASLLKRADFIEDTINCISAASAFNIPEVQLAIDIGGQSITSVLLNEEGEVVNFMRNDKCAAGSGRFLEVMSDKLNVKIEDIDKVVSRAARPMEMSAQCGVFAESEVITHVNEGEDTADIIAGVCTSVANMVVAQGRRFAAADHYTITGGVARVNSIIKIIREKLNGTYHGFPHDPQLAAAFGAALLAQSELVRGWYGAERK